MSNVLVTVETPSENQVVEVSYDGQEILQPPLTLGEHLTKQAHKIDFDRIHDDDEQDDQDTDMETGDEEEEDVDADEKDASKMPTWPWESVRNKLRDAHTEMSVLHDVITISTKDCGKDPVSGAPKRYMVLDGPVQYDPPDTRPYVTLLAKKKSLDATTKILLSGAQHLTSLQSENKNNRTAQDFHLELLRLRQNWRLKKVSNTILGDLSYRTAGSQFKASGVFEVVKSDGDSLDVATADTPKVGAAAAAVAAAKEAASSSTEDKSAGLKSALKVNVPSGLEGIAYIQVRERLFRSVSVCLFIFRLLSRLLFKKNLSTSSLPTPPPTWVLLRRTCTGRINWRPLKMFFSAKSCSPNLPKKLFSSRSSSFL